MKILLTKRDRKEIIKHPSNYTIGDMRYKWIKVKYFLKGMYEIFCK